MAKYRLCVIFLNSFAKPGRAAVWKLPHKLILWSNFEVAARPGFAKEFKNISHKLYLVIILTCLRESGDSKKIGEAYSTAAQKPIVNFNSVLKYQSTREGTSKMQDFKVLSCQLAKGQLEPKGR